MTQLFLYLLNLLLALLLAPLLFGIINRTKAIIAGRHGKPLLQSYYDLAKLCQKSEVISPTTGIFFQLAPALQLMTSALVRVKSPPSAFLTGEAVSVVPSAVMSPENQLAPTL